MEKITKGVLGGIVLALTIGSIGCETLEGSTRVVKPGRYTENKAIQMGEKPTEMIGGVRTSGKMTDIKGGRPIYETTESTAYGVKMTRETPYGTGKSPETILPLRGIGLFSNFPSNRSGIIDLRR